MKRNITYLKVNKKCIQLLLFLFTISIFYGPAYTQERKLIYDVIKSGNVIGEIVFLELVKDQKKLLSLTSNVKTKFIFSFSDQSSETASFEDGVMIYSTFYQKQNGSDKAKKMTIASGQYYKLVDDGVSKLISYSPIRYNMLLLYTNVPESTNKVYSDNFQKLLNIKKIDENKYRLELPDGNYNYYTYKNGICNKVDIKRTFFTVQFVLRER